MQIGLCVDNLRLFRETAHFRWALIWLRATIYLGFPCSIEKKKGASCSGSAKRSRRTRTGWMVDSCVYRTSTFPLSARFSKTLSHRSHIEHMCQRVAYRGRSPHLLLLLFYFWLSWLFSFHEFLPNLARKWTLPFQFRSKIKDGVLRVGPPGASEPLRLEISRDADLSSGTEHVVNYIPYNFHV